MTRTNRWLFAWTVIAGLVLAWAASPAPALPPDPDNAALLYYQAFLTMADLDKEARDHMAEVARGTIPPDEKARESVKSCRAALEYAEAAKDLRTCNWGFRYSQGFAALMPQLAQMRFLTHVVLADARLRASDGDYRGALERCLLITDSFARHIGDDTLVAYLVSVAVQRVGCECMQAVIGQAAGDAELLRWLQGELAALSGQTLFPLTSLKVEMEISLDSMQKDKIDKLIGALAGSDAKDVAKVAAAADEQLLARARRAYSEGFTSAMAILSSPVPYEQAHVKLSHLTDGLDPNDPISTFARAIIPALDPTLSAKTSAEAYVNATKAAVEICLQRAQTGKLPEVLPAGLPKDPFSGQDFRYERTAAGFVLRCRGKDLAKDKTYEFTFKLK
jgi:hypothetical protein